MHNALQNIVPINFLQYFKLEISDNLHCVNNQVPRPKSQFSWTADQFYSSVSLKRQKQFKPGVNSAQKNKRENASEELQAKTPRERH